VHRTRSWLALAAVIAACRHSGHPDGPPGHSEVANASPRQSIWRRDYAWTRPSAVAVDGRGRIAVVGHRLAPGSSDAEPPRAVGIVRALAHDGRPTWSDEIDGAWVEGIAAAVTADHELVVLLSDRNHDEPQAVVARWSATGALRWQRRFELGPGERPRDLAVGPAGEVAFVTATRSTSRFVPATSKLVTLDEHGKERWQLVLDEASIRGEAIAVLVNAEGSIEIAGDDGDQAWVAVVDDSGRRVSYEEPPLVVIRGMAATLDGGLAFVGEPDESEDRLDSFVRLDRALQLRWRGWGVELEEGLPTAVAVAPDARVWALAATAWIAVDGEEHVEHRTVAASLEPHEVLVDLAFAPDGSVVLVGERHAQPWGRVDTFVLRLEGFMSPWPQRGERPRSAPVAHWTDRVRDDVPLAEAMVRWLAPKGPEPRIDLPSDEAHRRAVATSLLLGGTVACQPVLVDEGPDYAAYEPGRPGRHSTLDDPCLRLALALEMFEHLTGEDFALVEAPLTELLLLHDDDVEDGHQLGEQVLDLAFAIGHGPQLAEATMGRAHTALQSSAIERLAEMSTAEGREALREFVDSAPCELAMEAVLALESRGERVDLDGRPPGADADVLIRRWCLLRHHPDRDRAHAYWASLLPRSGKVRYVYSCAGDWPTTREEMGVFEPCEESVSWSRDPPSTVGDDIDCVGTSCTLASERYEESFPHGFVIRLEMVPGRDGELYVGEVTRTDWLGDEFR
jgi:hypothetical protein